MHNYPEAQGLYDPNFEHDACGVSFIADLHGRKSHRIVDLAMGGLANMQHRGATNAEPNTGDGAGILVQVPDKFCRTLVSDLPEAGHFATGIAFLPTDESERAKIKAEVERIVGEEGLAVLAWTALNTDPTGLGDEAVGVMPVFEQVFISSPEGLSGLDLDRELYIARRRIEAETSLYFSSLSCRTLVYKGMLTTPQLASFSPILRTQTLSRRWRWFIADSQPTPSPLGLWPIRIDLWLTTVSSTRLKATATGCTLARHY